MAEPGRGRGVLALAATLAAVGLAAAAAVWWSATPAEGPAPVAWDRTRCERCGMLVSERGFATQLHTRDGRTRVFDDPGCLFLHREEEGPEVHRIWLRHHREPRWLPLERVVFERVETSPMGYGLAARERGELDGRGLDPGEARRRVLELERSRSPGGRGPSSGGGAP